MTTIAFKNGVLAADRMISSNSALIGSVQKLYTIGDAFVGCAGSNNCIKLFFDWLRAEPGTPKPQMPKDDDDTISAIVFTPHTQKGAVDYYWSTKEGSLIHDVITCDYFAIGSGKQFAMGAMAAGATAEEAVRAACKHDPWSGGGIDIIVFDKPLTESEINLREFDRPDTAPAVLPERPAPPPMRISHKGGFIAIPDHDDTPEARAACYYCGSKPDHDDA